MSLKMLVFRQGRAHKQIRSAPAILLRCDARGGASHMAHDPPRQISVQAYDRLWPILLQKSFSIADQKFSSPLMRFADKCASESSSRDKLIGGFANGLGAILIGAHSSALFLWKKSSPDILGLLQPMPTPAAKVFCVARCFVTGSLHRRWPAAFPGWSGRVPWPF